MPTFNATLLFVIISFVVFTILMKAIYFDPIMKIKNERERKIIDDQESAVNFAQQYEILNQEYQAGLKKARQDAHSVIQEIRQQAKTSAQKAVIEARTSAQAQTDQQMAELDAWRESTYRQLESERASLTQAVIAKVKAGGKIRTASGS